MNKLIYSDILKYTRERRKLFLGEIWNWKSDKGAAYTTPVRVYVAGRDYEMCRILQQV